MSPVSDDLLLRVPTLTEVLQAPEMPDLGEDVSALPSPAGPAPHPDRWAEAVMSALGPQVDALVSSRLRDMLAPALQEAVEEVVERFRGPMIQALDAHLRELLEVEIRRSLQEAGTPASAAGRAPGSGETRSDLQFP